MKPLNKMNSDEIIDNICKLNKFYKKLNNETYYNLVTSTKYINYKTIVNDENNNLRIYKTQLYSMLLALDDIKTEIENFMEEFYGKI